MTHSRKNTQGLMLAAVLTALFTGSIGIATADYVPGSLVAHWKFDDGSGDSFQDRTLAAQDGTLLQNHTTPTFRPNMGRSGMIGDGAAEFNGARDIAYVKDPLFDIGTEGAASFWVRMDNKSRRNIIMEGPGNGGVQFQFRNNSGGQWYMRPYGLYYPSANEYSISSLGGTAVGTWFNVQYTWNLTDAGAGTGIARVLVNGAEAYISAAFNSDIAGWLNPATTSDMYMNFGGEGARIDRMYDGLLDEMVFYNRQLDDTELAAIRTMTQDLWPANPIALWNFDEAAGTVAADESGNGIDFVFRTTDKLWMPDRPTTYVDGSLGFHGDYGVVDTTAGDPLSTWDKRRGSVTFWVRRGGYDRATILGDNADVFDLQFGNRDRIYFYGNKADSGNNFFMMDNQITDNDWHHVVFSWDLDAAPSGDRANPGKIKAYLDGAPVLNHLAVAGDPDNLWGTPMGTGNQWIFGAMSTNLQDRFLEGNLADFAFFDVVLTPDDVVDIMDDGVSVFVGDIAPAEVWVDAVNGSDGDPGTEAEPFQTIQRGVDAVANNGLVHVEVGSYPENVSVNGKYVNILGAGDRSAVVVDSEGGVAFMVSGSGAGMDLRNVRVVNSEVGVVFGSEATEESILSNTHFDGNNAAVLLDEGSDVTIDRSTFTNTRTALFVANGQFGQFRVRWSEIHHEQNIYFPVADFDSPLPEFTNNWFNDEFSFDDELGGEEDGFINDLTKDVLVNLVRGGFTPVLATNIIAQFDRDADGIGDAFELHPSSATDFDLWDSANSGVADGQDPLGFDVNLDDDRDGFAGWYEDAISIFRTDADETVIPSLGDVVSDGIVELGDALRALQVINGTLPPDSDGTDANAINVTGRDVRSLNNALQILRFQNGSRLILPAQPGTN